MEFFNEAELKLINSLKFNSPILLIGAGFSSDAVCNGNQLPKGAELRSIIFNYFYIENTPKNINQNDLDSIERFDLSYLCEAIRREGRGKELDEKLIEIFKGALPSEQNPYHENICNYHWDKIYTLNIDDLLENIFTKKGISYVVQNEPTMKTSSNCCQIIKLHGCVNNPQEGFIFSQSDYVTRMAKHDYRMTDFAIDYFKNDIIFLGTEYNEYDLQTIIEQNENKGFKSNNCKYFFITPEPGYLLKSLIDNKPNFYHIPWDTKRFLDECSALQKHSKIILKHESILKQIGFKKVKDAINIPDDYECKLYFGAKVNYYDVLENWDIVLSKTSKILKKIEMSKGGVVTVVYGDNFCGKSVVANRLLIELYKIGYEAYSYNCEGTDELERLYEYINCQDELLKIAVLIDDSAYIYEEIAKFVKNLPNHVDSIVFILVSETRKHQSKKYELKNEEINFIECKVTDQLDDKIPQKIYNKLYEKNRLGKYKKLEARKVIEIIKRDGSLIEFLFKLTQGEGFKKHFKNQLDFFLSEATEEEVNLFNIILVLTKMGIYNMREELLILNSKNYVVDKFKDMVVGFGSSSGINLRCAGAYDEYLYKLSDETKVDIVCNLLISFSHMFREEINNRWKNVFEQLLRTRSLLSNLHIEKHSVIKIFARIEKYYDKVSYFWLQRGLAKQEFKNYDEANIFLEQALSIRPNSYKIRHAIAKNKINKAIDLASKETNFAESCTLFDDGLCDLIDLMENPLFSWNINYSVSTYILDSLKFYRKLSRSIPKEQILYMNEILNNAAKKDYDSWMEKCRAKLYFYCKEKEPSLSILFERNKYESHKKY